MTKLGKSEAFCCFCFDKRSAIFVIATLALLHSAVNVVLGSRLMAEPTGDHVYVVAVSINTEGASHGVKKIFNMLAITKVSIFSLHTLSSLLLITAVCYRPSALRTISSVFILTEVSAVAYTTVECVFTIRQLNSDTSKGLLAIVLIISVLFMGWCIGVVTCFARELSRKQHVVVIQGNGTTSTEKLIYQGFTNSITNGVSNV